MSQFTKKAIEQTFISLLNERPLDKITVKDIVTSCGVNRNTFYYYFEDIYGLIDDIFQTETEQIIGSDIEYDSWQESILKATNFAIANKQAIFHIYKSISRERLENYLLTVCFASMQRFISKQAEDLSVTEDDINLLAKFYTHALVGMVLEWISDGMKEDASAIINKVGMMLDGNIRYTLSKVNPNSPTKSNI